MFFFFCLKFNRLSHYYEIPTWICCDMRGNSEATKGGKLQCSAVGGMISLSEYRTPSRGSDGALSCSHLEASPNSKHLASQKIKKVWKRRDCLQQRARQERLDSSRSKLNTEDIDEMTVNMAEDECPFSLHDMENKLEIKRINEEASVDPLKETSSISDDESSIIDDDLDGVIKDSGMMLQDHRNEAEAEFVEVKMNWRILLHLPTMSVKLFKRTLQSPSVLQNLKGILIWTAILNPANSQGQLMSAPNCHTSIVWNHFAA
jgi:hypothetical protein